MMTPQEVSEHAFSKASFGGYNMAMVDEFLDQLTEDYTALYKENASLKVKMKVLADSVEEYRATEKGMRRALLAAQQAADEMVKEAETRKADLIRTAEAQAAVRAGELRQQVADEEARLNAAKTATGDYVRQISALCKKQMELLAGLDVITAPPVAVPPDPISQVAQDIQTSVQRLTEQREEEEDPLPEPAYSEAEPEPPEEAAQPLPEEPAGRSRRDLERARAFSAVPAGEEEDEEDASPTRRIDFDNLQFGSNYDLK